MSHDLLDLWGHAAVEFRFEVVELEGPTHQTIKDILPKFGHLSGRARKFEEDAVDKRLPESMLIKGVLATRSLLDKLRDRTVHADRKLNRTTRGENKRVNSSIRASA